MALSMSEVILKARSELKNMTDLDISSTIRAVRENGGYLIAMEVVEKHSIPDGMDILATYEAKLDSEGDMLEFKRTRMRKRIDTEDSE